MFSKLLTTNQSKEKLHVLKTMDSLENYRGKSQSLLTKSRNKHSLEMEIMPPHMTFMLHHIDFSLNCKTMA